MSQPENSKVQTLSTAAMLSVRNGAKAVAFYKAAFGAGELFRFDADDGTVIARLAAGGAEFWVADESSEHLNFSPESLGGCSARMIITVEHPESAVALALAAGATSVLPVAKRHGWLIGRVVDPFGHHWEIGKPLSEGS